MSEKTKIPDDVLKSVLPKDRGGNVLATKEEIGTLLYLADKYDLDPIAKEIYILKYKQGEAARIFPGRDGFLAIAHKSEFFDGMETFAVGLDGKEYPTIEKAKLSGAVCRVYRKDWKRPIECSVSLREFSTGSGNWGKMPEVMIKKVAESHALRKAFNVSGFYDPAEMPEGEDIVPGSEPPVVPPVPQSYADQSIPDIFKGPLKALGAKTVGEAKAIWSKVAYDLPGSMEAKEAEAKIGVRLCKMIFGSSWGAVQEKISTDLGEIWAFCEAANWDAAAVLGLEPPPDPGPEDGVGMFGDIESPTPKTGPSVREIAERSEEPSGAAQVVETFLGEDKPLEDIPKHGDSSESNDKGAV